MAHNEKHIFAVYVSNLSERIASIKVGSELTIANADLYHRIYSVLRLNQQEEVILFDEMKHIFFILNGASSKGAVHGVIKQIEANTIVQPSITVLLPMLKREAFNDALYACVELGATSIQPIVTHKTFRDGARFDEIRLKNIMIAAAEQSKNFSLPILHKPLPLQQVVQQSSAAHKFYADPVGKPLLHLLQQITNERGDTAILVGPEGGLMAEEKQLLDTHGFIAIALTPTILRAQQAVVLGLGALRLISSR